MNQTTQSFRAKMLFGQMGVIALVTLGYLNPADTNDAVKVDQAYKEYDGRIAAEDPKSLEAKVEFGATMALLRGIKDVADNTMAISPEKVAAAIARAQARQMIDFSNIDTGFNPGFTMLLVGDITTVENDNDLPPAEMIVGAGEMLQVLGYVDVAYTAFMLAGIPQEVLDRAFDRAILNQRLTTAIKVYGVWATEETAIS